MKKLLIDLYSDNNPDEGLLEIECTKLDAVMSHTIMYDFVINKPLYHKTRGKNLIDRFCLPCRIDRFLIINGYITIHYQSGFFITIRRIND
jgi:hypothetical protein